MEDSTRPAKLIVVCGFNGTGKTTLAKQIIKTELQGTATRRPGRVLIVTPDMVEWSEINWVHPSYINRIGEYSGPRKIIYKDGLLNSISAYFKQGLVVFDDCRAYLTAAPDKDLVNLFIRRRQKAMDIMLIAHGLSQVPPVAFTYISDLILFQTKDNLKARRADIIQDFDRITTAQKRINQRATDTTTAHTKSGKIYDNIHYYEHLIF